MTCSLFILKTVYHLKKGNTLTNLIRGISMLSTENGEYNFVGTGERSSSMVSRV